MSQKLRRVFTVLVVSLATLGILLGSTFAYNRLAFTKPLEANVTKLPAIGAFKFEKLNSRSKITVQFNVPNKLRTNFYQLLDQLQGQLSAKTSNLTVEINNKANEQLGSFLTKARLPVHEAISTGEFTALPGELEKLATNLQVQYDLEIDNDFIFLSVSAGSETAHMVINRGDSALQIINTMGGEYL